MIRSTARRLAAITFPILLSGCSLAPHYAPPTIESGAVYRESGDWMPAAPADELPREAWWAAFGDDSLNALERRLPEGSANLRAALARLEQARALALEARSAEFPTLDALAAATHARRSANAPTSAGVATTGNDLVAGLSFKWEIDLFGRLRNAATAANARVQAAAADVAAVELALRAQLASDYFSLRGADATSQLLDDTVTLYSRALELTRDRYRTGIAAATDVEQAQTQLADAQAQRAAVALQRAQLEHAIAVLIGETPARFSLASAALAADPPALSAGVPSLLLQRRPDIARAERAVAAANAEVGVARAAWFPVFVIGGAGGYEATRGGAWFQAPSRYWLAGPVASLPLLDAGARQTGTRRARAALDEAVAQYRQSALDAYREVEDSLVALRRLAEVQMAEEVAAAAALASARHAQERYEAGIADYLEVASTRSSALSAQRSSLDARVNRLNAAVALVRALGGGWEGSGSARSLP
jgi:outer membrane protein, multidrug efflux system